MNIDIKNRKLFRKHTHIMTQASAAITGPTPYFGSGPPAYLCGLVGRSICCVNRKIEEELAGIIKIIIFSHRKF